MKKLISIVSFGVISVTLVSCNSGTTGEIIDNNEVTNSVVQETNEGTIYPYEITSLNGKTYTIEKEYTKILSLAPGITELLVEIGLEDKLVAVDTNSLQFLNNKDITALNMLEPNMEEIISLEPEVVFIPSITVEYLGIDTVNLLENTGIKIITEDEASSISDIRYNTEFILDTIVGEGEEEILSNFDTTLEKINNAFEQVPQPKKVFFEISEIPYLYSFGEGVFINEMLTLAGGENIFATEKEWFSIGEESIVELNPQYYFTNVSYIENHVDEILAYENFQDVEAIKTGNVYYINSNYTSLPNYKTLGGIIEMGKILHGDLYDFQ